MRILKHKNIDYSEVSLSELGQEMRFDADYWEPSYLKNEDIITAKKHSKTKSIAPNPQYGISVAMNEEAKGYSILKMDNIMELLAEDKDAKFAEVSEKTFKQFQLKKFDVLFNRVNSDEFVGRTGIYLMDGEHTFASYLVRVDSGKPYTNCYLAAYLNCKYGKTALQRVKRRAVNQANINAKELSNLNIPTPSETLQKEAQELLVDAQKQKELSNKLYQAAHDLLFQELGLINWKPKEQTFKLYNQKLKVEDTVNIVSLASVFSSDRIDSEYWLPKYEEMLTVVKKHAVDVFPLNKIILFNQRGVQPLYVEDGEISIVNSRHIGEHHIDYDNLEKTDVAFFNSSKTKAAHIKKYDILTYTTGAYVGKTNCYLKEIPAVASNHVNILRVTKNPIYIGFVLNTIIGDFQTRKYAKGSAQVELYPFDIQKFLIPLISEKHIKKIEKLYLDSLTAIERSKTFLDVAKRAVEIFIEQDEKEALKYIKNVQNKVK